MGRERYRLPELAQDCPLLAQSEPLGLRNSVSRRGRWPRPFSASSTRGGCRWQHLWGQQLRLTAKAAAMPHFLDWFVPVYLFISVLILVGFGACIYYFEP
ncbi:hypothetical protein E2I00_010347, partial [Balaenoptera physalus]